MKSLSRFLKLNLVMLSLQVSACDDAGNSIDASDVTVDPVQENSTSQNRNLSGNITSLYKNQLWSLDLSSGEISKLKRAPLNEDSLFNNLADFEVTAAGSGKNGYLLGVNSCYMDGFALLGCIQYLDKEGLATKTLYFDYNISTYSGALPFSKSGSYFAARSTLSGRKYLSIYSREGKRIGEEKINTVGLKDLQMDWSANDVLYYTKPDDQTPKIYYWILGDEKTSGHYEFEYDGKIGRIDTHPFENKIAFELLNSETSIYIADLETGKAFRLVQPDGSYEGQFFTSPEWSPDGRWILAQHNNSESVPIGLAPYNLIAIPSDSVDVVYDLTDQSSPAKPFRITDDSATVLGANSQTSWFRGGSYFWVAD